MSKTSLYIGNSNTVELTELTNEVTGTVDTGATVSCTVYDSDGAIVSGPNSMPHDAAGTYRAILASDISITAGDTYSVQIDATGTGSEVGRWTCSATATVRTCGSG